MNIMWKASTLRDKFFCFVVVVFVFFETEIENKQGRGRDRGRQNPKQALHCQCRAPHGARTHEPGDHDLSPNQESDA